jgi:plastocyanin domain-containing protein
MNRRYALAVLSCLGCIALLGASAFGCSKSDATTAGGSAASPPSDGKANVVNVIANDRGFTPSSVEVKKGEATTLVFTRTTDDTCAKEVVFPELKVTKELPLNQKVPFEVPATDARTLAFQCGMGMFKGKIVVQ